MGTRKSRDRLIGRRLLIAAVLLAALIAGTITRPQEALAAPLGTIYGVQAGTGIFAMAADGAGRHIVLADPNVSVAATAPAGTALAYADKAGSSLLIATLSGTPVATTSVGGQIGSIAWSPDSATVAFTSCAATAVNCSLESIDPDGTGLKTLIPATSDGSGVAAPISWGPYGLVVDLIGSAGGAICEPCAGLPYALGADGSVAGPVLPNTTDQLSSGGYVSQAAGAGALAYATGASARDGAVLFFGAGSASVPLSVYNGFTSPALSPDGSMLVMSNGHQVLEAQPGTGATPQPIASFSSYGISSLSWVGSSSGGAGCTVALQPGSVQGIAADPRGGYWITDAYGSVAACGSASDYGGFGGIPLNKPVVSVSAMPDGNGYRLGAYDGGVLNFGDATVQHGPGTTRVSLSGLSLSSPVWSLASTSTGNGYWLATTDGHIYTFGDAGFFGPTRNLHLVAPLVQLVPTPDGKGYWMASSDGGVFSFGDAIFSGSLAGRHLPGPIIGMSADPSGGYWLVGSDGTVYPFGGAPALGSTPGAGLSSLIRAMAATPDGRGYWLVDTNGRVYVFGDATYAGSASQSH